MIREVPILIGAYRFSIKYGQKKNKTTSYRFHLRIRKTADGSLGRRSEWFQCLLLLRRLPGLNLRIKEKIDGDSWSTLPAESPQIRVYTAIPERQNAFSSLTEVVWQG